MNTEDSDAGFAGVLLVVVSEGWPRRPRDDDESLLLPPPIKDAIFEESSKCPEGVKRRPPSGLNVNLR